MLRLDTAVQQVTVLPVNRPAGRADTGSAGRGWPLGLVLAALFSALGSVGCGIPDVVAVPQPPAPSPPLFQPQGVEVALGELGGILQLMTTREGGFTLDGEAFSGGEVQGNNGMTYLLTLEDGTWTARHVQARVSIELGTSGGVVRLDQNEDGTFIFADASEVRTVSLSSTFLPDWAQATNGNEYELRLVEGAWEVLFVPPPPFELDLGTSGDSVTAQVTEDGRYWVGDSLLVNRLEFRARNGNAYAVSVLDRALTATYLRETQAVSLGITGEAITVERSENGDFWIGDASLRSGDTVAASDGREYSLSIGSDGVWSATYAPNPPISIALGTSGAIALVGIAEDGSYRLTGFSMVSGATVEAGAVGTILTAINGNRYRIIRQGGEWASAFVEPAPTTVQLGTSGETIAVIRGEDGSYWLGDRKLISGDRSEIDGRVTTQNGNRYVLTELGGTVRATFLAPEPTAVPLGTSGGVLEISRTENGGYTVGNRELVSGGTVRAGDNEYTLTLGTEGSWTAEWMRPEPQTVLLGTSGSMLLQRGEDGTWTDGDQVVLDGATVTAGNGREYVLTIRNGRWSAAFKVIEMPIEGTGLTAVLREDGPGYSVGGSVLAESGTTDLKMDDASYSVWMEDGQLKGLRYQTNEWSEEAASYAGDVSTLEFAEDDRDTPQNEARTALLVAGDAHLFGDLLGEGASSVSGANFLAEVREELAEVRSSMVLVLDAFSERGDTYEMVIDHLWGKTRAGLEEVFGSERIELDAEAPEDEKLLGTMDELIKALSSAEELAAAAEAEGGVFEGLLDGTSLTAQQVFEANKSEASVLFGVSGTSSFGAVARMARPDPLSELAYSSASGDERPSLSGGVGAFAYSTSEPTAMTRHVGARGTALYQGGTRAVSGDGILYQGDVTVRVFFSTRKVDGLITNLVTPDGEPLTFVVDEVFRIRLPTVTLGLLGAWKGSGMATLTAPHRVARPPPMLVDARFEGSFVGGNGATAGDEIIGNWRLGSSNSRSGYVVGGYAAERSSSDDLSIRRPKTDDGTGTSVTERDTSNTALGRRSLQITLRKYDWVVKKRAGFGADDEEIGFDSYQRVQGSMKHEFSLQGLFRDQGVEFTKGSAMWVTGARQKIEGIRKNLRVLVEHDLVPAKQEELWKSFQNILGTLVFEASQIRNSDVGRAYDPDDGEAALEVMDRAIEALSSQAALKDALEDSDGVFTHTSGPLEGMPFTSRSAEEIWTQARSEARAVLGSTAYTRFGVWSARRSRNAVRSDPDGDGTETTPWIHSDAAAFAYSPLSRTSYENDLLFPSGVVATYEGETLAVATSASGNTVEPAFLTGTAELTVSWRSFSGSLPGQGRLGTVTLVVSELEDEFGDVPSTAAGGEIDELVFGGVAVSGKSGLTFSGKNLEVRVVHRSLFLPRGTAGGTGTLAGKFLGKGLDGPLSVLGRWTLTGNEVSLGNGRTVFEGAFGADLPELP